jgi:hypothetical protein
LFPSLRLTARTDSKCPTYNETATGGGVGGGNAVEQAVAGGGGVGGGAALYGTFGSGGGVGGGIAQLNYKYTGSGGVVTSVVPPPPNTNCGLFSSLFGMCGPL